jgi:hypothetical protein
MRTLALLVAVSVAAILAACKKPAPPVRADEPLRVLPVGELLPPSLDVPDYVGAAACAECHRAEFDAWQRSPHGRSMAAASQATVLASFDASPLKLPDGEVAFSREGDAYFMDLESGSHRDRRKVDVVLASGRQHQLYAVKGDRGALTLLPVVWSTTTRAWLPLSLYQPVDLAPESPSYWASQDMTRGCVSCHLSQSYRRVAADGARSEWVDLSINCESCHGPGREHVKRRREGRADDPYRDLSKLGSVEESRVCGGCHGFQLKRYVFPPAPDGLPQIFVTSLINDALRPDGTQHLTSYQYPGHVLSAGFAQQALRCKDCHAPHGLEARGNHGESAVGALTNRQCTGCHEKLVDAAKVAAHSHHPAKVHCVDCHMSESWIGDDDRRRQRTSDHSVSIPHPQESIELGTPDACTTCHKDHDAAWALAAVTRWGFHDATGVRSWVKAIAEGRKGGPDATRQLEELLADPGSGKYLRASALDLLGIQRPDAGAVASLAPYATDPDPYLRAAAIRSLDVHDPAERARWRSLGLADAHPYVRMETFSLVKDVETLTETDIEKDLEDVMAYMSPPTDGIVHLVTVRHRRGELRQALELLGVLDRITLPQERQHLHLDTVRARVEADRARRDAAGSAPVDGGAR